jgi:non-ribosomal peptide synthetase component E (peptide arylation enzyme)
MNLFNSLEATAARLPEKNAVIEEDAVVTYAELLRRVDEFSDQIRELGFVPAIASVWLFPTAPHTSL